MPNYNRVMINGQLPGGEVWSVGLSYGGGIVVGPLPDLQAWANDIATFIQGLSGNALVNILSNIVNINEIRVEERDANDNLLTAAEAPVSPVKVGAGSATKTLQTSFCISLLTAQAGRSFRGRVYWPAYGWTGAATTMRFTSGDVTAWLAAFKAINVGIIAAAPPEAVIDLIVRSRLLGLNTFVTQFGGGDVPDVQRRRRDALVEVYQLLAV